MLIRSKPKKKVILPLSDVEIGAWPEQNFLFGLLLNQETGWDWIMNQFIQLRGAHYINYQYDAVDFSITFYPYGIHQLAPNIFDLCPFINKYIIPRSFISEQYKSFHEFVKNALNNGYYLSTFLDQFFRRDFGGNYGFRHPTFIYGYDDANKEVCLADNFEHGKYQKKQIRYDQLDKAFMLVPTDIWEMSVFLYKLVPYQHSFYTTYVKEQLQDYLNPKSGICYLDRTVCQNPHYHGKDYENEVFFGIEIYQLLFHYLNAICEGDESYPSEDWRSFVMLCDHKKVMIRRYEYMTQGGYMKNDRYLLQRLEDLEKKCEISLNMFLKYTFTNDIRIIERLKNRLEEIREQDVACMELFIKRIL